MTEMDKKLKELSTCQNSTDMRISQMLDKILESERVNKQVTFNMQSIRTIETLMTSQEDKHERKN